MIQHTFQQNSTGYRFVSESFDSIAQDWKRLQSQNNKSHIFSTFELSQLWWQHFGNGCTLYLGSIKNNEKIIGIVPLHIKDSIVQFIGSANVCDYLDFIVEPQEEQVFFDTMFNQLTKDGCTRYDLSPLRPDSTIMTYLNAKALLNGLTITAIPEDVTFEMPLPDSWDTYLKLLTTKQRHELRRKIRRVSELGNYEYRTVRDATIEDIETFLRLFRISRDDKQAFLTQDIETFFRDLIRTAAKQGWLELNFMNIGKTTVAATLCFRYNHTTYLYNSGYDPAFSEFSVGLVSKALGIKASIESKQSIYDFLKGSEVYKQHLGGREIPIYRLAINMEQRK